MNPDDRVFAGNYYEKAFVQFLIKARKDPYLIQLLCGRWISMTLGMAAEKIGINDVVHQTGITQPNMQQIMMGLVPFTPVSSQAQEKLIDILFDITAALEREDVKLVIRAILDKPATMPGEVLRYVFLDIYMGC